MRKAAAIGLCLIVFTGLTCFAEMGFGITGAYSVGAAVYYGDRYGAEFDPPPIFLGAFFRWKPSIFQLEVGAMHWPNGDLTSGYLDGGLCFSPGPFRIGLSGGIDSMILTLPGWESLWAFGANAKVDLDLRLGSLGIGMSVMLPLDVIMAVLVRQEGVWDVRTEMRITAGLASVNLTYWFGSSRRKSSVR
jgi:hypothetical protein